MVALKLRGNIKEHLLSPVESMALTMYETYHQLMMMRYPGSPRYVLTWEALPEATRDLWVAVATKVYDKYNLATVFDDR